MANEGQSVSVSLYILAVIFSVSTWLDIDAILSQLPLLIDRLPEYWTLPSYIDIMFNVAVIFPILYVIGNKYKPHIFREVPVIFATIAVGIVSTMLLMFSWNVTAVVGGERHSVGFLSIVCACAVSDSMTTVVFMGYFAKLPEVYMTAFYFGDGLSGLIPSTLALIQGVGDFHCVNVTAEINATSNATVDWKLAPKLEKPLFSMEQFFCAMCVILCVSAVAFALINYLPFYQKYHVHQHSVNGTSENTPKGELKTIGQKDEPYEKIELNDIRADKIEHENETTRLCDSPTNETSAKVSRVESAFLILQMGVLRGLKRGVLAPLQSYSLLPYGNLTYGLGNRLGWMTLAAASFLPFFVTTRSTKVITLCTSMGCLTATYIMVLAVLSPSPPLLHSVMGPILAVGSWLVTTALLTYGKVVIGVKLHSLGRSQLMLAGLGIEICMCLCSTITFLLINVANLFEAEPLCSTNVL